MTFDIEALRANACKKCRSALLITSIAYLEKFSQAAIQKYIALSAIAHKHLDQLEAEQVFELLRILRTIGSRGGKKAGASLTPAQRKERAQKAAQARWEKSAKTT